MMYEVCVLYINVSAPAETLLLQNLSLSPSLPLSVCPDMALCLPTFSLLLIVNETSLSLSLSVSLCLLERERIVMPLCDSHIPINVPFTFRDKQPCLIFYRARLRGGSRATASIEPSLIRLSIMSSLEHRVAVAVSLCAAWSSKH